MATRHRYRYGLAALAAILFAAAAALAGQTADFAEIAALPAKVSNFAGAGVFAGGGAAPLFENGGPLTAPAASTVLVDTGKLAPGCYLADLHVTNQTDVVPNTIVCAHRDKNNASDLSVAEQFGIAAFVALPVMGGAIYEVWIGAQNERVACRIVASATAGKIWQADLTVWPCP